MLLTAIMVFVSVFLESNIGQAASFTTDEWTRGSGQQLEIRIQGEVFNPDGTPATNLTVDIMSYGRGRNRLTAAEVQSNLCDSSPSQ